MIIRARHIVLALVTLVSLGVITATYLYTKAGWKPDLPKFVIPTVQEQDHCPRSLEWLNNLTITFPVKFARRDIIVNPNSDTKRDSITKLDVPLFPDTQVIDLMADPHAKVEHCVEPLILDVPSKTSYDGVDASHIFFGMSTDLDRLETSIPYLQRWLPQSGAKLFVIAMGPDETDPDSGAISAMESKFQDLGMDVSIFNRLDSEDHMPERYFSLIKLMYAHRDESTAWISVIDDDTFFPSMHTLVDALASFDPAQQWYIGGMSEEWWAVVRYGFMAFGGAGIFLSLPLAAILNEDYEDCKSRSGASAGDMRIRECVHWHSRTKLTHLDGLHQIDMHGDLSGLYESGRLQMSLHHWKQGWWDEGGFGTWFPMHAMHAVADVCGDCFLQRWQFHDSLILANGYSISTYPTGKWEEVEREGQVGRMEDTWEGAGEVGGSNNGGWDHSVGPLRERLELEKEKVQWRFLDARIEEDGVRQWYIHLGVEGDLDSVFEIFWRDVA